MESTLEVIGSGLNKIPDAIRLAHNDVVNLSTTKVFVRRARHLEILSEEHDFEGRVCAVTNFDHLEGKILPCSVDNNAAQRDQ